MTSQDTIRTKEWWKKWEVATESCCRRALDLCDKARAKFELDLPTPRITFDLRGHCAGQYVRKGERDTLRFNFDLLDRYPQEMLDQTVPHEVAHFVARHVHMGRRIRAHGREWKAIMRFFGCEPSRCHNMETTPARRTRKYVVVCDCQTHPVGTVRYNRISQGTRQYMCMDCRGLLRVPTQYKQNR